MLTIYMCMPSYVNLQRSPPYLQAWPAAAPLAQRPPGAAETAAQPRRRHHLVFQLERHWVCRCNKGMQVVVNGDC